MEYQTASQRPLIGRIALYLAMLVCVFAASLYLQLFQPMVVKRLILSVDVFGITDLGMAEKSRLNTINNLPITYEEKQVLMNRTVFLGATRQMVTLALGEPNKQQQAGADNMYIYYLPDDPRPTILKFSRDRLVQAYKGSALDFAKQ